VGEGTVAAGKATAWTVGFLTLSHPRDWLAHGSRTISQAHDLFSLFR